MGMDVIGNNEDSEVGRYFRNNVWWWRPLWMYCEDTLPEVCDKVEHAHMNCGDGLDQVDSMKLGNALKKKIESGECALYARQRHEYIESLPLIECDLCEGTGGRQEPPTTGKGTYPCNACDSKGKVKQWDTHYPFSEENVQKFINFLLECGGFKIC